MELLANFINLELILGGFNFLLGALPVGYLLILLARWLFPDLDGYLSRAKPVIAEIDDRLAALLLEWDNHSLKTISDVVQEIRSQLRKAGYILDEVDEEKIEAHIKASIKKESDRKEGLSLSRDLNEGIRIEFRREF